MANLAINNKSANNHFVEQPTNAIASNNNDLKTKTMLATQPYHNNTYLRIKIMEKMIYRFLNERNMTKVELAKKLETNVETLEQLLSHKNLSLLIPKICLPLIMLYCETDWKSK